MPIVVAITMGMSIAKGVSIAMGVSITMGVPIGSALRQVVVGDGRDGGVGVCRALLVVLVGVVVLGLEEGEGVVDVLPCPGCALTTYTARPTTAAREPVHRVHDPRLGGGKYSMLR